MEKHMVARLMAKNDKYACSIADRIIAESGETDAWYAYFDDFVPLLDHPKSLVRNRALHILAANARWDAENRFDAVLPSYLAHVTDEKPITARQCIQALPQIGKAKPQYIPLILRSLKNADLSGYRDSMRPLIQRDIAEAAAILEKDLLACREAGRAPSEGRG